MLTNVSKAECILKIVDKDFTIPVGVVMESGNYYEITNTKTQKMYRLEMEVTGSLKIKEFDIKGNFTADLWTSETQIEGNVAHFQENGNLVVRDPNGSDYWSAGTHNNTYKYNGAGAAGSIQTMSGMPDLKRPGFPVGQIDHEFIFTKDGDILARTKVDYEGRNSIYILGILYKIKQGTIIFSATGKLGTMEALYKDNEHDPLSEETWHTFIVQYITHDTDNLSVYPEIAVPIGENRGLKLL